MLFRKETKDPFFWDEDFPPLWRREYDCPGGRCIVGCEGWPRYQCGKFVRVGHSETVDDAVDQAYTGCYNLAGCGQVQRSNQTSPAAQAVGP